MPPVYRDMRNPNSRKLTVKAEPAEVDEQLKKQIEFYFSDSNLPRDKFLLHLTQKTPEGWVSLETISEFKKMRDMGATVRASEPYTPLTRLSHVSYTPAAANILSLADDERPHFSYLDQYISDNLTRLLHTSHTPLTLLRLRIFCRLLTTRALTCRTYISISATISRFSSF
jgi:hypothetical protein